MVGIQPELCPLLAPQLDRVLCALGAITAAHIIGRTEVLAAPADALGVARMEWKLSLHDRLALSGLENEPVGGVLWTGTSADRSCGGH